MSWRWVFYLNIPVSIVIFLLGLKFLPRSKKSEAAPFDIVGSLTLISGLPLLLLAHRPGGAVGLVEPADRHPGRRRTDPVGRVRSHSDAPGVSASQPDTFPFLPSSRGRCSAPCAITSPCSFR